jgi:hypothetical protein
MSYFKFLSTNSIIYNYRWAISTGPRARHEDAVWAGLSPAPPGSMRAWVGLGQETRHGGLVRHGLFTSKLIKPVFCTKTCLPVRLTRFSTRFFVLNEPARLDPLRAGLDRKLSPRPYLARFSNRA